MQDRCSLCPPTFSLAAQWPSHFFHSRISTGDKVMGVGKGDLGLPWILKYDIFLWNFYQKRFFSSFREEKMKFHHFYTPGKIVLATPGKIHYWPSPEKNPFGAHGYSAITNLWSTFEIKRLYLDAAFLVRGFVS